EDYYGPLKIYELLEKHDAKKLNHLIIGPWNHGGWARGDGSRLGKIEFDNATAAYYREKIQAPFFNYYLKDKVEPPQAEATTFQTGSNQWKSYDAYPPRQQTADRNLYFQANGRLSFEMPSQSGNQDFDSYISDPANPVPYRPRPV